LRQIVTNLTGNAIKFTEKGTVRVVVSLKTDATHSGRKVYAIDVIDSGIGIPNDKLESIFEAFVQADASVTRRFGGTGLGLSISRRFARALGGDIVASSTPGKGSTFAVTVECGPLEGVPMLQPAEVLAPAQNALAAQKARWEFPPSRILVVDDGAENRQLVALVLDEYGITVEEAENGQIGLQKALAEKFDVVLMDIQMPVMDGDTATRKMREHGLTLPIYALTANLMQGFEDGLKVAGFTGYLAKPIDIDKLLETLADTLGGRRAQDLPAATPTMPAATTVDSAKAVVEGPPLISRLADKPRLLPAVRKFSARLNEQLDAMDLAWSARDLAKLAALAHWLKGAAGTVGYDVFTEPAIELEQWVKAGAENRIESALAQLRHLQRRIVVPGVDRDAPEHGAEAAVDAQGELHVPAISPEQSPPIADGVVSVAAPAAEEPPLISRLADKPRLLPAVQKFTARLNAQMDAMDVAWKTRNLAELGALAHWLKGAAGTVGYDAFTEPAIELEKSVHAGAESSIEAALEQLRRLQRRIVVPGTAGDAPGARVSN
jgi:CheY-like chemotaxis protein